MWKAKSAVKIHRELLNSGVFNRYTQEQLAERLGVHQTTICRIARGEFKKPNKAVKKICEYAKIDVRETAQPPDQLLRRLRSLPAGTDHQSRQLVEIIDLAVDLLRERAR